MYLIIVKPNAIPTIMIVVKAIVSWIVVAYIICLFKGLFLLFN